MKSDPVCKCCNHKKSRHKRGGCKDRFFKLNGPGKEQCMCKGFVQRGKRGSKFNERVVHEGDELAISQVDRQAIAHGLFP